MKREGQNDKAALVPSKIYNFIDDAQQISFYFLEGQSIINDLALGRKYNSNLFSYNRDVVLSLLPLNSFLKSNESLGLFIDSERPYFRFKLELHESGTFRTMMYPEVLNETPDKLVGYCRITKVLPSSSTPYCSIVKMDDQNIKEVINHILEQSYQTQSHILLSNDADQSVLINILPSKNYDKQNSVTVSTITDALTSYKKKISNIMAKGLQQEGDIIVEFKSIGLNYLGLKQMKFFCPCSHKGMVGNVKTLPAEQLNEIFKEDGVIDITCDYCQKNYQITPEDCKIGLH